MSPKTSIDEPKEQSPSPPNNFKFRGRGKSGEKKKPNPWTHAHDEYAVPKTKKRAGSTEANDNNPNNNNGATSTNGATSAAKAAKKAKSPKGGGKRPVRIRFDTEPPNTANAASYGSEDEELEEKSNRPLHSNSNASSSTAPRHKPRKRPKKKPTYVNAANIHGQEFRSAYRAKPLPPTPQRKTNAQRVENGKEQFNNMIKQAAAMEGVEFLFYFVLSLRYQIIMLCEIANISLIRFEPIYVIVEYIRYIEYIYINIVR